MFDGEKCFTIIDCGTENQKNEVLKNEKPKINKVYNDIMKARQPKILKSVKKYTVYYEKDVFGINIGTKRLKILTINSKVYYKKDLAKKFGELLKKLPAIIEQEMNE